MWILHVEKLHFVADPSSS